MKNPIIVIGNKADPATPFLDASRLAGWLGDSAVLVELDGYGHTSFQQFSTCIVDIVKNFFVKDARPTGRYTVCSLNPDAPSPFPSNTTNSSGVQGAILSEGSDGTSGSQELDDLKSQKRTLLIAVIALAAACGILLISLVVAFFVGRRGQGYKRIGTKEAQGKTVEFPGHAAGESFIDPYDQSPRH